jgi:starch synthase (maltosyl-transferring)
MAVLERAAVTATFSRKVIIENVHPEIDGGRFPIKRVVGERVEITADIFTDGHDVIRAILKQRSQTEKQWVELPMLSGVNDHWSGQFSVSTIGRHFYTLSAWVDRFQTWTRDIKKKFDAGQDISVDVLVGVQLIEQAADRAGSNDARELAAWAQKIRGALNISFSEAVEKALDPELGKLVIQNPDTRRASHYPKELEVIVDRERARFSSWYELFPRSCADGPARHGTLLDCMKRLDYVAEMGFDVLYLPPIHPIGYVNRKGKNNMGTAGPDDFGSPWAIGSKEGGHKAIHPKLGTIEDFKLLAARTKELGMEIALDLAFQCAPDHPYVTEHKDWFRLRPDGTVQYAENPPKKYQDIYPLDFDTEDSVALWEELRSVVLYWVERGVRIFRVDNPHTKPFSFWEWLISEVKSRDPNVLFLAEAFTRPKIMYELAKLGFTQSYTYFSWRNTKPELTEYFTELTKTGVREYFRPNLWPNTPDILTEILQHGGRPAFMTRLILAATLGASYGIYGPAFELGEHLPLRPGSEEYLNSEKYQIRNWDLNAPGNLKPLITWINKIRRENPALQSDWSLRFHQVDNEQLIVYSKATQDLSNIIVVVLNLDLKYKQSGWVDLPLADFHVDPLQPYQVHDLLTDAHYFWNGSHNYVELDPQRVPAHVFRIRHMSGTASDLDYLS